MLFFVVVLLVAGVDPNRLIWEGYKRNHKGGVPPQVSTCYLCINTVLPLKRGHNVYKFKFFCPLMRCPLPEVYLY